MYAHILATRARFFCNVNEECWAAASDLSFVLVALQQYNKSK